MALGHDSLSPLLARDAVWLARLLPYTQATQVLTRIGGYQVPTTTVWEQAQQVGQRWWAAQQHAVGVERTRWESRHYQPQLRKSVGMDGGMVNIRGEGWKELKVGVIGTLTPPWELSDRTAQSHELHYAAHLGSADAFAAVFWRLAVEQQLPYAGQIAITADGAAWIWRLALDLFPCSTQIVDWYHAAQHLAALAQIRFPDAPLVAQGWAEQLKRALWHGDSRHVLAQLRCADLPTGYFEEHQRRMNYPDFRAQGYPVGSGSTESGVKQYKQRFCGPGMRWSRPGVDRMLVLRSAVMDSSFDQRWAAA